MNSGTLTTLLAADDAEATEAPKDFDWDAAIARVEAIKVEIERLLGRGFVIDRTVQDASFFTDLSLQLHRPATKVIETVIAVRFSSFGDLFTTWSYSTTEQLPAGSVQDVIKLVERHGFRYVAADELNEPYTGPNRHLDGTSWWIRFFDYL